MEITRIEMENIIAHVKRGGSKAGAEVLSAIFPDHPGYQVGECFVRATKITHRGPESVEVYLPNTLRRVTCANTDRDIAAAVAYLESQVK